MENLQNTISSYHSGMYTYLKNDSMSISYDKTNHMLIETYIRPPSAPEFRQGIQARLMAMRKFVTGKVISNIKLFRAPKVEEQYKPAVEKLEQVAIMGYSYAAMVVPHDIIYNITIYDTLAPVDFSVVYFDKREDAIEWIMMY